MHKNFEENLVDYVTSEPFYYIGEYTVHCQEFGDFLIIL